MSNSGSLDSRLPPGKVFIWITDASAVDKPDLLAQYESLLSSQERERHRAFHFEHDRHLYLVAHALVRTSLSRYADVKPQDWCFVNEEFGRPKIVPTHPEEDCIRFNLSHTHGLAACAIARDVDVGIDVEPRDRKVDWDSIAPRYFSPFETQQLIKLPPDQRKLRFLEYWTLKEAHLKARGSGLTMPLDCFHFHHADQWQIVFADGSDKPQDWQFICLQPTEKHVMSVAIHRPDRINLELDTRHTIPMSLTSQE